PIAAAQTAMTGASPDAFTGLALLRLALGLDGLLLLAAGRLPAGWFASPGLPVSVSGLVAGPQGWPPARRRLAWRPLVLILLVGAGLRLAGLNRDLWLDEAVAVKDYFRLPVWQVIYSYNTPTQHLLYSILGSLSLSAFGESPWAARLPAVVYGVGGLAGVY